jgi:tetratricopeptide (TPR) repeat protein
VIRARSIRWLTILASVAMAATSSAAPPDQELRRAEGLYKTGDFRAAARIAESVPSVRGQTLAARATLAVADYATAPADRPVLYGKAARLARTAIEYDPQKAEAYRYLVIALGHIARTRTPLEAFFEGYADEGRRLIDRAMMLEPESPWGYAVLGAWHTEVVAVAGAALAKFLYDASAERAKVAFETAIRLEPDNPVLRFEYAQALVRLGGPGSAAAARNQWAAAAEMTPRDAVETIVTSRARRALEAGSAEIGEKAPGGAISKTGDEHP